MDYVVEPAAGHVANVTRRRAPSGTSDSGANLDPAGLLGNDDLGVHGRGDRARGLHPVAFPRFLDDGRDTAGRRQRDGHLERDDLPAAVREAPLLNRGDARPTTE